MKNRILIFTVALGIILFFSACEKNDKEPKLNLESSISAEITNPINGSAVVLTLADSANPFIVQWSATSYIISGDAILPMPTYSLQVAFADSAFKGAKELISTQVLSYESIVYNFNKLLLTMGMAADSTGDIELRVLSGISDANYTESSSEIIRLTVTTFEIPIGPEPEEKFIYLLGDATPAGWDNTAALPMTQIEPGIFARVETLDPAGSWFKFISVLGFWAPQWGTDATGTAESGPLVYRPDEATTDPPAMPSPAVLGDYYIEADTINLVYSTFLTSGELYLVGAATTVGWDNTAGLPLTEVEPHIFEITTTLTDGGMKLLEVLGQWAPQWGLNAEPVGTGGNLSYRPSETVQDPPEIPSPGSGTFKIRVDLSTITYTITPQ